MRWWTSDEHYGNPNICLFSNRPWLKPDINLNPDGTWKSIEHAHNVARQNTTVLNRNANQRIKPDDTAVCVGDIYCKGNERGVPSLKITIAEILKELNGTWILVSGNHDGNNGVKSVCDFMSTEMGHYKVGVQHIPLLDERLYKQWAALSEDEKKKSSYKNTMHPKQRERSFVHAEYCRNMFDFIICGHVHGKWQTKMIAGIWHINVGVDANRYMPINDQEVLEIYEKAKKGG